jgi:glutaredoxin
MPKATVTIYTANACPSCAKLKRFLDWLGVEYSEKNIESDMVAQQTIVDMGALSVPVTSIGDRWVVGLDRDSVYVALIAEAVL